MAPCEGCIALKNESAALKERVAELERSNRDLRLIRKEEDKLEALHTTLCNPSFLGITLPWDSSDSLPDVEPELRVPPMVDRVLEFIQENGPLALTHSGVANVASSTPLPNLPTEAGLGSVSIRHHDLHGPMVAAPSLRRATSLPALLSPLASPDPAPAGDEWHPVVRSKMKRIVMSPFTNNRRESSYKATTNSQDMTSLHVNEVKEENGYRSTYL